MKYQSFQKLSFIRLCVFFTLFIVTFTSCKRAENRSCLKFTGKDIQKEFEVDEFENLIVYPYIECTLIQDSLNKVVLIGGEKLVNQISIESSNKKLILENTNKCTFLRSYS